jgi:dipeptidyl aminopeptidase/acylaminoacyl peptidase/tetratricopeptide (TPR) repeat protein
MNPRALFVPIVLAALGSPSPAAAESRTLRFDDVFALKAVSDPRLSPDGAWVAYTVRSMDPKADESDVDVYMVPLAGGDAIRVTTSKKPETSPRFSPDGRYLAFLSGRDGKKGQVWLLERRGGEAVKLTDYKGGVSAFEWSPDGTRLAVVASDPDPDAIDDGDDEKPATETKKTPPPIVIRRLQFKRDEEGYLRELRSHVYVFDVKARTSVQVTRGPYDDGEPAWSPDSQSIAFSSNRTKDADANRNTDIFVVAARAGQAPRAVASDPRPASSPAFSPDGRAIVFVSGGDPKDMWYAPGHLAAVPLGGGPATPLTAELDRAVSRPRFSADGKWIYFLLEDGGNSHLARIPAGGGAVERVVAGEREISAFDLGTKGEIVVLESQFDHPEEVSAAGAGGTLRRLTHVNDELLKGIRLGRVERIKAKSADGTAIDAFLTYPPDAPPGRKLPAVLRIHGGPVDQFDTGFSLEWQILAANGYAVIAANPRGSSGYGLAFSRAIWADWGNKDFDDVMAAVDRAVAMGVADPDRLGVGGWSYGGILTDNVITRTGRFKAAISGASEANYFSNYGTDHYQYEWETELGLPWRNVERWVKMSPWFSVEKVTTPTLLMGGSDDMNVPLLNSEQLYQALRRLGVPTELVIYPGQHHGIRKPTYVRDRYQRYVAWYDRYLKPAPATSLLGTALYPPEIPSDRRRTLEDNLAQAQAELDKHPDDADAILWLGRRQAYLGRFRDAVATFTRGVEKFPDDIRFYRHRGHRYVTLREFDHAIADLQRAADLIESKHIPEQPEPDGDPRPGGLPTSSTHFNVYYHLGLAHYLKGEFDQALAAYREGMKYTTASDDRRVAMSDWLYMTLRRLGRKEEAAEVLRPITRDLKVADNTSYFNRLLMYKGEKTPEELLGGREDPLELATYGYGIGNWYLVNGDKDRAVAVFRDVVAGPQWPAFGFIAAEADLARMR